MAMAKLAEQVQQGPAQCNGMMIVQLALVQCFDVSGFPSCFVLGPLIVQCERTPTPVNAESSLILRSY